MRHLTEIVNSNADLALGHVTTDTEETDEMVPPKNAKANNNNKQPKKGATDPGHMNMKGVFLHVLSDALGKFIVVACCFIFLKEKIYNFLILLVNLINV